MPQTETIAAQHLEPLGKTIGELFDFQELGIIVHKCAGEPEMNGISAENIPRWHIARNTLIWVGQNGYTKTFLAYAVAARPNSAELRDLITLAFPQALEVAPQTKAQVDTVVSALHNARSELSDPRVKQAIAASTAKLQQIVTSLRLLESYKNLHDSLHNIQLLPFSVLRRAVHGMNESTANVQTLRMYHDQVRTAHTIAESWVARFPDGNFSRASEEHWINNMEAAAAKYQEAIDDKDVPMASLTLNLIRRILDIEPVRLNNLINVASKTLPLADLMTTLQEIINALGENDTGAAASVVAFRNALNSLRDLHALLRARVVEHDLWQDAENVLWSIERAFEMPANDAILEFATLWPAAKITIQSFANDAPNEVWAKQIKRYSDNLDDSLLHVESQLPAKNDGDEESFKEDLWNSFDIFRREARYKFFSVDHQLKEDCAELVQISEPLETILQELDNG